MSEVEPKAPSSPHVSFDFFSMGSLEPNTTLNPVLLDAQTAYPHLSAYVSLNHTAIARAAQLIHTNLHRSNYTPRTWHTHPLHISPAHPYNPLDPSNKLVIDWIFLISSLNFSFWSAHPNDSPRRFGVRWKSSWDSRDSDVKVKVHTGYWSLVAALDRALQDDRIPITDPTFYSDPQKCPDSLIQHVFRPAYPESEQMPLLKERIRIMRENGAILCKHFNGSFQNLIRTHLHSNRGANALDLVKQIISTFPSFRDEPFVQLTPPNPTRTKIRIWKRAQILVAELWAAFYPPDAIQSQPHPLFPNTPPQIQLLTMFADYRVPQVLHHLSILTYPPHLTALLEEGRLLEYGCREEVSIRVASVLAVDAVREGVCGIIRRGRESGLGVAGSSKSVGVVEGGAGLREDDISSVLIDFYLWDLAKSIEMGNGSLTLNSLGGGEIELQELLPTHRTRSVWY